MRRAERRITTVAGLIAAVLMMGLQSFGVEATDSFTVANGSSTPALNSEVNVKDGNYANFLRFAVSGGAIDGVAAADIALASLGVWMKKNGDYTQYDVYLLNDNESYFEADYFGPGTNYVGLGETEWFGTGGTNGNVTATNMPHGPFFDVTNAAWDTHLTLISTGVTSPGTPGGTDDRDNILGDDIGGLFPIQITELEAFKTAVSEDTNGEITLMIVGITEDSRRTEFASVGDGVRTPPTLTVLTDAETTPPVPLNLLVVTERDGVVELEWDISLDPTVQGYNVYRSQTPFNYTDPPVVVASPTATGYQDTTVVNGQGYYYSITAFGLGGVESGFSGQVEANPILDVTPPAIPVNVTALAGNGSVLVDWDDNTDPDLAGYNVYRSTTSASYGPPLTNTTLSVYSDTDVENGTTYYYVITAFDDSISTNESDPSIEVMATPDVEPPPPGTILFGSSNAAYGGFSTNSPLDNPAEESWSLQPESVRYTTIDPSGVPDDGIDGGAHVASLLKSYNLDRTVGSEYTVEGVVDLTGGYGDDNNRIGILLLNTNASQNADGGGGLYLRLNTDDGKGIAIMDGINGANGGGTLVTSGTTGANAGEGNGWFGQRLTFRANILFTESSGTNVIDVTFTLIDQTLHEDSLNVQVAATNYPGTYFGFASKARNRGVTSSDRNADWIMDYVSFYVSGVIAEYVSPLIAGFSVSGGNVTVSGTSSANNAGAEYQLQSASDLSLADWSSVATDTFDESGNFSATAPVSGGDEEFYRVEVVSP